MSIQKRFTINDLVESKGPIWIINTANKIHKGGSEVQIVIAQGDQQSVLTVPRTWLPMEVTARYPREAIVKSQYFMEALSKELISVIDVKEADKLMVGPTALKEKRRLDQIEEAIRAANSSRGIGKNVTISTGDPERDAELADTTDLEGKPNSFVERKVNLGDDDEEEADAISAQFRAWVLKLNAMTDVDEVKSELKTQGDMDIEEAIYLMTHIDHEEIQDRIRKRLMKLGELPKNT